MIAKLKWSQSNARQNMEQLHNPTLGVTINSEAIISTHFPSQKLTSRFHDSVTQVDVFFSSDFL